ncbi:uncharacterized protein BX664DRAFT_358296 [Halteromyces radiatus]|uniref:uncharacterized protein n=1 Tax=Halteromyces radiatus TaxID=101107 RepID=UPI00221E6D39|nr:uncharacterized protein BX664DRAFT_358296 [Halteromyces radiatus]KAI8093923.1 hypothetical protein BX664DRAFT_358296 [Halteromyces radiatus]
MLAMVKGSRGDLKRLFYVLNLVVTSFCFIHVADGKEIYDDLKQLVYVLKVVFTSFCFIHVDDGKEILC